MTAKNHYVIEWNPTPCEIEKMKRLQKIGMLYRSLVTHEFKRLHGQNWKLTTFSDCAKLIDKEYVLLPEIEREFNHEFAWPRPVYHYNNEQKIVLLRDVTVWPYCSIIQSENDAVVVDSGFSGSYLRFGMKRGWLKRFPVKGESMPCAAIQYGKFTNHYHWYIDTLPRLYALHHPELREIPKIKLLLARGLDVAERRIVEALIPENVVVEEVSPDIRIRADQYIHLPPLTQEWDGFLPEVYLEFYRKRVFEAFSLREDERSKKERVYISRRKAKKRRIENEEQLERALSKMGFSAHCLEDLSLAEQVRLFRDAAVIVAPHGAGLTNMIYSKSATVVEFFSSNYPGRNHYRLLAASMGHDYGNLFFGKKFRQDELQIPWKIPYPSELNNADITVEVDSVVAKLHQMLDRSGSASQE